MESEAATESIRSPKLPVFLRVFFALFFFTIAVSVLVSYAIPPTYEATAVLKFQTISNAPQENDEVMRKIVEFTVSEAVLARAVQNASDVRLSTTNEVGDIRRRLDIAPDLSKRTIEIRARGRRPSEAVNLAKSVVEASVAVAEEQPELLPKVHLRSGDELIEPQLIHPRKPRMMAFGALFGILFGALGGGAIVQLRRRIEARSGVSGERR